MPSACPGPTRSASWRWWRPVWWAARLPELPPHAAPAAGAEAPTVMSTVREHRHVYATLGVGVLLVAAVRAVRPAVIPLWADHLGLDATTTALIYGLAGGIDMLLFYPAGKVMDLKGRRAVAVPAMLVMGTALVLMPLTQGAASLLAAALAVGIGNGIGSGMVMTIGADHSPRVGRAHFLGVWRLMADLGAAGGPVLLSLLTASASLGVGIAAVGLLSFVGAGQLGYWLTRAGRAPANLTK